jgi:hypothetical protein
LLTLIGRVALALLAVAVPCAAQVRIELTPLVGIYAPTAPVVIDETFSACPILLVCTRLNGSTARQQKAIAVGARLTAWFSQRFAMDLSFEHSRTSVRGFAPVDLCFAYTCSLFGSEDTAASVVTGSARLLVNVIKLPPRGAVYLVGGWGFESRGGPAYRAFLSGKTTNWGPVLGVGSQFRVLHWLAVRAEVEDYLFSIRFQDVAPTLVVPYVAVAPSYYEESFRRGQNDVNLSVGFAIAVFGREH